MGVTVEREGDIGFEDIHRAKKKRSLVLCPNFHDEIIEKAKS